MRQEMNLNVLPKALQVLRSLRLSSIDANIQGLPNTHAAKKASLSCAGIGEIFDSSVNDDYQKCGMK